MEWIERGPLNPGAQGKVPPLPFPLGIPGHWLACTGNHSAGNYHTTG